MAPLYAMPVLLEASHANYTVYLTDLTIDNITQLWPAVFFKQHTATSTLLLAAHAAVKAARQTCCFAECLQKLTASLERYKQLLSKHVVLAMCQCLLSNFSTSKSAKAGNTSVLGWQTHQLRSASGHEHTQKRKTCAEMQDGMHTWRNWSTVVSS